ncbi:MAG TPA: hypothetical protein VKO45_02550 [Methanomicrobiales archaeon]|nr:hypothetical protein [Methanomicrobiales archaeon]
MTEFVTSEKRGTVHLFERVKQQQVILTASVCVIALTIVLKNVLLVPAEVLTRDMAVYTIIYLGFLVFAFRPEGNYEISGKVSPLTWDALVVLITLTVLAVYAL